MRRKWVTRAAATGTLGSTVGAVLAHGPILYCMIVLLGLTLLVSALMVLPAVWSSKPDRRSATITLLALLLNRQHSHDPATTTDSA